MFFSKITTIVVSKAKAISEKNKNKSVEENVAIHKEVIADIFRQIKSKAKAGERCVTICFNGGFPEKWDSLEVYFRKLGYRADFDNTDTMEPAYLRIYWD